MDRWRAHLGTSAQLPKSHLFVGSCVHVYTLKVG
eukprot:SAG31_NODE_39381_length_288_cov_1.634921_2_plen_33_part_01